MAPLATIAVEESAIRQHYPDRAMLIMEKAKKSGSYDATKKLYDLPCHVFKKLVPAQPPADPMPMPKLTCRRVGWRRGDTY